MKLISSKISKIVLALSVLVISPCFAHASTLSLVPPSNNGLVVFYSFNEGTGTIAHDFSGNGNNATLVNSPTWTNGNLGGGLIFNGTSSYATMSLPALSNYTIALWVNPTNCNSAGEIQFFDSPGDNIGVSCKTGSIVANWAGASSYPVTGAVVTNGQWMHVVITSSSGSNSIYINGVLKATGTASNSFTSGTGYIGQVNGGGRYYGGKLDNFRIYNYAFTSAQVAQLYKSGQTQFLTPPSGNALMGYWNFNEGTGTIAHDFSGNGNNGTIVSSSSNWTNGKLGSALSFNGSSYVSVGSTSEFSFASSNFTVCAWVYPTVKSQYNIILNKGDGLTAAGSQYELLSTNNNVVNFDFDVFQGNNKYNIMDPTAHSMNQWYFVCGERNGSINTLYKNAVSVASSNVASGNLNSTNNPFNIGVSGLIANNGFIGKIDEVRVYGRALSQAEINQLYKSGQTVLDAPGTTLQQDSSIANGLVGYWTFDGGQIVWGTSISTALDSSGNGMTGTLVNMSQSTSPAAGKIGQALQFNGVNQYINIGSTAAFDFGSTTSFSLSVWLKTKEQSGSYYRVISNGDSSWTNGFLFQAGSNWGTYGPTLGIGSGGLQSNGIFFQAASTTINDGKWHLVTGVFDQSAKRARMYIDGVQVSIIIFSGSCGTLNGNDLNYSACSGYWANHSVSTQIGRNPAGGSEYFNGSFDDVRIYNRALSASEVNELYQMGK